MCRVITNSDVAGIVPTVIQAYADPTQTEAGLDALSGCTFIQVRERERVCFVCVCVFFRGWAGGWGWGWGGGEVAPSSR